MEGLTLNYLRKGDQARVTGIYLPESQKQHLATLGLVVGAKLDLVLNAHQKLILMIKDSRLGLDLEVATHIAVQRIQEDPASWTSLDQLVPGQKAKVMKVEGNPALRKRIMDMGITKNARIIVKKLAPLGDPMELTVRSYQLSLRKQEAENILVVLEEESL